MDGYKSRKLALIVLSQLNTIGFSLLCVRFPALFAIYSTFCGTIVSLAALYSAANLGEKHVLSKAAPPAPK